MYWFFISLISWQDIFIRYMIRYVRIFLWDLCLTCAPVSHEIFVHMQPFPGNSNFQMKSYFVVSETCHFMPVADSFHGVSIIYVVRSASYQEVRGSLDICLVEMLISWNPFLMFIIGIPVLVRRYFYAEITHAGHLLELHHLKSVKAQQTSLLSLLCFMIHYMIRHRYICSTFQDQNFPDSKIHGANMGPTWVLLAPCWPHEPYYQGEWPCRAHQEI